VTRRLVTGVTLDLASFFNRGQGSGRAPSPVP